MKPDTRSAEKTLRERAERLLAEGRTPPFEQTLRAVQKTVEEFKKPDMQYTVSQGILFLTPLSTRAEAWLDETLLDWTMVDGTVSVQPERIDAAVEALGAVVCVA